MASTKEIIAPGIRCDVTVVKAIEFGIKKANQEIAILKDDIEYFKSVGNIERVEVTRMEIAKIKALIEKWETHMRKCQVVIKHFKNEYSINNADVEKFNLDKPYTKAELEKLYENDIKQAEKDTWTVTDSENLKLRKDLLDTIKPQLENYMKKHGELAYSIQDKIIRNELDKNYPMSTFTGFEKVEMPSGLVFQY